MDVYLKSNLYVTYKAIANLGCIYFYFIRIKFVWKTRNMLISTCILDSSFYLMIIQFFTKIVSQRTHMNVNS